MSGHVTEGETWEFCRVLLGLVGFWLDGGCVVVYKALVKSLPFRISYICKLLLMLLSDVGTCVQENKLVTHVP